MVTVGVNKQSSVKGMALGCGAVVYIHQVVTEERCRSNWPNHVVKNGSKSTFVTRRNLVENREADRTVHGAA